MKKKIILYADGSQEKGLGHLYRSYAIWTKYLQNFDYIFLYTNNIQKKFFLDRCLKIEHLDNFQSNEGECIFFVDTKEEDISFLDGIRMSSGVSLSIDSYRAWVSDFDISIFPSFYYDSKLLAKIAKTTQVFSGKEYVAIRSEEKAEPEEKFNLLITFGGSDPNDITTKVIEYLQIQKLWKGVAIIIGPGFSKCLDDFQVQFPEFKFINNPSTTYRYIKNSAVVMTALGTTVQEIEYLGKKGIICFNYKDDQKDFNLIQKFSSNAKRWRSIGYFQELSLDQIENFLDPDESSKILEQMDWGSGWDKILTTF